MKTKPAIMSEETAAQIVEAGMPAKAPSGASLDEYVAAEKAIMRYKFALSIAEKGRENVLRDYQKTAAARRRNGCGCDNAPDCLCNI